MTTFLSTRHQRFVAEYLQDGNATQAYIRAGYKPRGAQGNASKLLHQPHIEAAVEAGRARMAESLQVTAERISAEYAKIAFASIDHFIDVDAQGRIRIDLAKAGRAQRDGLLELSFSEHGEERLQRVKIKLGKLQALAALQRQVGVKAVQPQNPAHGLAADLEQGRLRHDAENLRQQLARTHAALAAAEAKLAAAGLDAPSCEAAATHPPQVEEAAVQPSRSMDDGHGTHCPLPETRPTRARQAAPRPPARVPEWPEPGAPLPVRGSPDHAHAYSLLRRGALDSATALQLIMAGLDRWP
jgi:phage terminase small subunit